METWQERIEAWRAYMEQDTGLAAGTILAYSLDLKNWAAWANQQGLASPEDVTAQDIREWRDAREKGAGAAAGTVNRRLVAAKLFFDFCGLREHHNPVKRIGRVYSTEMEDGRALTRNEWNAVHRAAERAGVRAEALANLLRYAGPRIGEILSTKAQGPYPLVLDDLKLTPRTGEMTIRQGKGRRGRTVPLVLEAREPLRAYLLTTRKDQVERWAKTKRLSQAQVDWWTDHPQAPVFLGERGPLTIRSARSIIEELGVAANLPYTLGPHDLRATMITALIDPDKYGINRTPTPLTVVARLVGHADIQTTARYASPSQSDLIRWMGETGD